jgi:NTE family protein
LILSDLTDVQKTNQKKVGLVLSGGGARGAYQAGVMKAVAEISRGNPNSLPISIITGVSAGAINASYLASCWDNPYKACNDLADLWCHLKSNEIFRTDAFSIGRIALGWIRDTTTGNLEEKKRARSFLDTRPLQKLIEEKIPLHRIQENLKNGFLEAVAVTAMNYANAHSITFVQGQEHLKNWNRTRRRSEFTEITTGHVMGSSAIPLFFPPIKVGNGHFGDGCLRNTAPLSPAIHLGSDKLIVVSVRRPDSVAPIETDDYEPTIARILGVIMNALLLDAIDLDMERMSRINETLKHVPEKTRTELSLRRMEYLWIRPSQDIGHMAAGKFDRLPKVMRYMMGGLGNSGESSELTSYLLFDPEFCGKLVDLGYQDGMDQRSEIERFLTPDTPFTSTLYSGS